MISAWAHFYKWLAGSTKRDSATLPSHAVISRVRVLYGVYMASVNFSKNIYRTRRRNGSIRLYQQDKRPAVGERDCKVVEHAVNHEEAVLCKKNEIWDEITDWTHRNDIIFRLTNQSKSHISIQFNDVWHKLDKDLGWGNAHTGVTLPSRCV